MLINSNKRKIYMVIIIHLQSVSEYDDRVTLSESPKAESADL